MLVSHDWNWLFLFYFKLQTSCCGFKWTAFHRQLVLWNTEVTVEMTNRLITLVQSRLESRVIFLPFLFKSRSNYNFPDRDNDSKALLNLQFSWPGCTHCGNQLNQPTNIFLLVVNLPFFQCEWAKLDFVQRMLAALHCHSVEALCQPGLTSLTVNGFMVLSFTLQHSLHGVRCVKNCVSPKCLWKQENRLVCSFTFMWQYLPPPLTRDVACVFHLFLVIIY